MQSILCITVHEPNMSQTMILHIINIRKSISIEILYDAVDKFCFGDIMKIVYTVKPEDNFAEALVYFDKWTGVPPECTSMPEGEFLSFMPVTMHAFANEIAGCTHAYIPFTKIFDHESWFAKNVTLVTESVKGNIKNENTFFKIQKIPGDIEPNNVIGMFSIMGSIDALEFVWSRKMQSIEEVLECGIMCKVYVQFEDPQEMYKSLRFSTRAL